MHEQIKQILGHLDLDALGTELGVKERSFRLARERGVFPAAWFPAVQRACADAGVECPMEVFNWKSPVGPEVSRPDSKMLDGANKVKGEP